MRTLPNSTRASSFSHLVIALFSLLWGTAAAAQQRLDDDPFEEDSGTAAGATTETADPFAAESVDAVNNELTWDEAPTLDAVEPAREFTRAEIMQRVSASVSAGCGAFAVSLAGAGAAFAHAGLWTLTPANMDGWVGLGFGVLPIIGAASGAALGSAPFVEPLGVAVSSGSAALGAGLGALTGFGFGALFAGDQASTKLPAENVYSAIVLTSTMLVASVGAAAGAAIAAPFFPADAE